MSQETETPDIINMSDADFMALDVPPEVEVENPTPTEDNLDEDENVDVVESSDGQEAEALASDADDQSEDSDDVEEEDINEEEEEANEDDPATTELNSAAQVEALLAPFRANGKDMSVKSVEEARTLMQMGANYNKKMAGLKPNLKLMRMLENNGLLDEGKLNHLIDLDKHDAKAISKLISDAKLDPLDIDVSSSADYTANEYTVTDAQMNLDEVLNELKGTTHYNETVELLGNTWDTASQEIVSANPHVIRDINTQIANGTYEKVNTEVERQRMMGGLQGVSDIEAYRQVGEKMYADQGSVQTPDANVSTTKVITAKQDPKLNAKRRAAGSSKSTPKTESKSKDFNPLQMSDDEFEKLLAGGKFA